MAAPRTTAYITRERGGGGSVMAVRSKHLVHVHGKHVLEVLCVCCFQRHCVSGSFTF
jgi:hypothetical protein